MAARYTFRRVGTVAIFSELPMRFWPARGCRLPRFFRPNVSRESSRNMAACSVCMGSTRLAVMVWSFLRQVLRDGKEASCQSAVARVVSCCKQQGIAAPTEIRATTAEPGPNSPLPHCGNSAAKWPKSWNMTHNNAFTSSTCQRTLPIGIRMRRNGTI